MKEKMMTKKTKRQSRITRRGFIGVAASATAFTILPRHVLAGSGETPPSEKLNVACIGVGGMGFNTVRNCMSENIAYLCDLDFERGSDAVDMFPKAKRYTDYRRMLEEEHKNIDAVAITTPNHVHVPAAVMAMKMGKPVFCEKPLGHNIHEVRVATELARETGLASQMGLGGHGGNNFRRAVEAIQAGAIGEVREVHIFCDNEWEKEIPRKQPDPKAPFTYGSRRPEGTPPVPENFDWNLWLGPAPHRPYNPVYLPRSWRGWLDFGGGRLGDMGCHFLDLPFWALDLKQPLTVEAEGPLPVGSEQSPPWLISRWTFAARGDLPPVELTWYDGNVRPDLPEYVNPPDWEHGIIFVGSEGMLLSSYTEHELHPKEKFADYERPPQTLPPGGTHREWLEKCKTGEPVMTSFDYCGPLTETVLLGMVAYRVGKKLEWDPVNLKATNCPEADQFIRRENREGWLL